MKAALLRISLVWLGCVLLAESIAAQSNTCPAPAHGPPSGTLLSPGFAQHTNYGNDLNCVYNIQVEAAFSILFTVNSFITENCCDKLYIYDGPSVHASLIIAWSGSVPAGSAVESSGNVATAMFLSDNTINAAGFSIQYTPTHAHVNPPTTARPALHIVDWRSRIGPYFSNRPNPTGIHALVLHHTVDPTAEATLDALNRRHLSVHWIAGRDGTIYKLVDEEKRAWHAGGGHWDAFGDMNDISVGIEIVNTGDQPFPVVQEVAVAALSAQIVKRWNISPKNIVAHADFQEWDKTDVSGYFDWKLLYASLGMFTGLYTTTMSSADQTRVLFQQSTAYNAGVKTLQQKLFRYGYRDTDFAEDGLFGAATGQVVEAFNRHFCPEIFRKETIVAGNDVRYPENKRWYGISEERLNFLLAHS